MRFTLTLLLLPFFLVGSFFAPIPARAEIGCFVSLNKYLTIKDAKKFCTQFKNASGITDAAVRANDCLVISCKAMNTEWDLGSRLYGHNVKRNRDFLQRVSDIKRACTHGEL